MKRIFIVGTQRSGSNLLRMMLNNHSKLWSPHPPNILKHFVPLEKYYQGQNERNIYNDVLEVVRLNPIDWVNFDLTVDDFDNQASGMNIYNYFMNMMDLHAQKQGCEGWICKSTHNYIYMNELIENDPNVVFIHLYRDPRDVTLSFMKADIGEKHPYSIAKKWNETQLSVLETFSKIPEKNKFNIRYEDLIDQPEVIIRNFCQQIDMPFEESMMEFYKSESAQKCSVAGKRWENLSKPVMNNNFKKYKKGLSDEQIQLIEHLTSKAMVGLNYELDFSDNYTLSEAEALNFESLNESLKKEKNRGSSNQSNFLDEVKDKLLNCTVN